MEPVGLIEEGGHGAWIAWAIRRHARRASGSVQLHPVGKALSGPTGVAVSSSQGRLPSPSSHRTGLVGHTSGSSECHLLGEQ